MFTETNALYYTFSTIAQTLAGAIALLGAFVLYRLNGLNAGIDETARRLRTAYPSDSEPEMTAMIVHGRYDGLLAYADKNRSQPGKQLREDIVDMARSDLAKLLATRRRLFWRFNVALVLTAGVMLLSVIILPFVPDLVRNHPNDAIVYSLLGAIGFGGCVVSYLILIRAALS
jgi:hypothetical protein